jgi:hypothetical protein
MREPRSAMPLNPGHNCDLAANTSSTYCRDLMTETNQRPRCISASTKRKPFFALLTLLASLLRHYRGREEFLGRYGCGNARESVLSYGDNEYDSKAIAAGGCRVFLLLL